MTCPDIGYSMPRKKFDSGKIRVLILNVYAACPEPDTSPYFRFSQEYGFVSTNIGTMTQLISHSVLVAVTYKPPNVKEANFLESISNSFAKIDLDKNGLVLMGDLNIHQLGKSSASRLLKLFAVVNYMKQLINEPTRITEYSKTLIDLIFTNREREIV